MGSPLYLTLLAGPVEALPVPKPVIDALVSVEITESATGRSGFQITFTLGTNTILQTLFLLAADAPIPVLRVVLVATFGGLPQVIMDGVIEHQEVVPDAMTGSSKLVVSGQDLSSIMDLIDLTGLLYPGMSPDIQVLTILGRYAAFGIIPEVVPMFIPEVPVPTDEIPVQDGTDLDYVKQLAHEAGYVFYVSPGPFPGTSTAYWGPQVRFGVPQPALNVNLDSWTNVESLNFRYQPRNSVTPTFFIQDSTTHIAIPILIPAVTPFNPPLGIVTPPPQNFEPLPDAGYLSPGQALMRGIARAVETADVVTGTGSLDVVRYGQILRARSLVGVRGAGLAFDGMHFVDSTTHNIKPGEYKQSFVLKRNGLISNVPVVPNLPF
jgi:hypothetical protein